MDARMNGEAGVLLRPPFGAGARCEAGPSADGHDIFS
jgi:hypothetical protein